MDDNPSGKLPNIYYNSISYESLRSLDIFTSLPAVESILLIGSDGYRYVRQDDPLWSRLHKGRLTTSRIAASLGLLEPSVKNISRKPDHGHLLGAYHHLCEEVYIPHFNACITTEKAALHNASMVKAFNEEKRKFLIAAQNQQKDDTLTFQFEKERMNKSRALAGQGLHSIRTAYGKVQEAATLYILSKIFPDSKVSEVGFCVPDPKITGDGRLLPPLGASPDALITHYVKKMGFKTIAEHIEIVEVKNTCPFGYANNHHVQHRRTFILSDRGPRTCPDAAWIPQVQWHILCANTQSGLLVSRSATKGLRVFRIYRDDEYIECMLFVIQKLYSEHVMRKIPPKKDCFAKLHQHQLLAQRTRSMAREAEVVVDIAGGDERLCVSGRHVLDDNLFLDKVVR